MASKHYTLYIRKLIFVLIKFLVAILPRNFVIYDDKSIYYLRNNIFAYAIFYMTYVKNVNTAQFGIRELSGDVYG